MKQKRPTRYTKEKAHLLRICPYPNHFCDGQPVPDKYGETEAPREPCEYYKFQGTFKSGCNHPKRGG
jgi:hypothetical protein